MAGKLFLGGVPTRLDVELLMKLDPQPGTAVSYDEVERLIQTNRNHSRFRTVTNVWRKKLVRERSLQSKAEGAEFLFLTADAALDKAGATFARVGRATGRLVRDVSTIQTLELTSEEKRSRHLLMVREAAEMLDAARKSNKEIAAPGAKTATLIRLAK